MSSPLEHINVVEISVAMPGPFCGMMLADHGAEVVRVERPGQRTDPRDPTLRSRTIVRIDVKSEAGRAELLALLADADGLIEGFRPGVLERLGLAPDTLLALNPKLVIGRMTGWGQTGPLAHAAGHDINYIALTGALAAIGREGDRPTVPMNLIGDYGGGAMMLAFGMVAGILHARGGGPGQVIDCAMTDGSALLTAMIWGLRHQGVWRGAAGTNLLDGDAHFYDTYRTSDDRFVSIGAIEPAFYALLLDKLGLADDPAFAPQMDHAAWRPLKAQLDALFATRTRAAWTELLEGTDACFAPVLDFGEAPAHPHNAARGTFIEVAGHVQPAPAPRFSATPAPVPHVRGGG